MPDFESYTRILRTGPYEVRASRAYRFWRLLRVISGGFSRTTVARYSAATSTGRDAQNSEVMMEAKTYTTIDRAALGWPSGPWDSEPDKVQWQDAATGLPCLAVRHPNSGHWCGFVGVADGHPWYGRVNLAAHVDLTFVADRCQPGEDESRDVCHIPAPGEPDHLWWFAFQCSHSGDWSPRDEAYANTRGYPSTARRGATYKPLAYVQCECSKLAEQLAATIEIASA